MNSTQAFLETNLDQVFAWAKWLVGLAEWLQTSVADFHGWMVGDEVRDSQGPLSSPAVRWVNSPPVRTGSSRLGERSLKGTSGYGMGQKEIFLLKGLGKEDKRKMRAKRDHKH